MLVNAITSTKMRWLIALSIAAFSTNAAQADDLFYLLQDKTPPAKVRAEEVAEKITAKPTAATTNPKTNKQATKAKAGVGDAVATDAVPPKNANHVDRAVTRAIDIGQLLGAAAPTTAPATGNQDVVPTASNEPLHRQPYNRQPFNHHSYNRQPLTPEPIRLALQTPELMPMPPTIAKPAITKPAIEKPAADKASSKTADDAKKTAKTTAKKSAVTTADLTRSILELNANPAASSALLSQMKNLSADFEITNPAEQRFGSWQAPAWEVSRSGPRYGCRTFAWAAPAVFHQPLYFEQPNLERYGHVAKLYPGGPGCAQTALSAVHFFGTIPLLPYKIGAEHPTECQYVLGHHRPGSCHPHQIIKPRQSARGLLYQGLSTTGLVFFIP